MIAYVTLGTNDLPRAAAFYDALLVEIGAKRLWASETGIFWGLAMDKPALAVMKPYDQAPATHGNGSMVALAVKHPEQVDAVYRKAIALGAQDEGPSGPRGDSFYIGYFRDPDGNTLAVFCMQKPAA